MLNALLTFLVWSIVLFATSCNKGNCASDFKANQGYFNSLQSEIYGNYDSIYSGNKIGKYSDYASIFASRKNENFAANNRIEASVYRCYLTRQKELVIECKIHDGLVLSKVYAFAYFPNDTCSRITQEHFKLRVEKKLSLANWHLVSWHSGVD